MPNYQFFLSDKKVSAERLQWHPDDVAAIKAAAQITAEIARTTKDKTEFLVLTVRLKDRRDQAGGAAGPKDNGT